MIDAEYVVEQLTEQIKEYVTNSGTTGVVVGLSGGIDSAVVHKLCRLALDTADGYSVYTAYIPDKFSAVENLQLILKLTEDMPPKTHHYIFMEDVVEAVFEVNTPYNNTVTGNLRSRLRMCFLYMLANNYNCLVAGTSNKTESVLGYYTKYGDGGVDFEVIGDLYKHEVYEIGRCLNLPEEVLTKAPSAGLWTGQTDEEELGYSYGVLDTVVEFLTTLYPSQGEHDSAILELGKKGITPKDVKFIQDMVNRNYHKSKSPPSLSIIKEGTK